MSEGRVYRLNLETFADLVTRIVENHVLTEGRGKAAHRGVVDTSEGKMKYVVKLEPVSDDRKCFMEYGAETELGEEQ